MFNYLLLLIGCLSAFADEFEGSEPFPTEPPCNFPDIDYLSDRIVNHLHDLVPTTLNVPDDTEGAWVSRHTRVFELDSFTRSGPSTYECTDKGIRIQVPLAFVRDVKSDFQVSPNLPWKTWVKVSARVVDLQAIATVDVRFIGDQEVHLTSLNVNHLKDVELGIRGDNIFAKGVRKVTTLIANQFRSKITKFIEKNFQELLEEAMFKIPLKDFGFQ